MSKITEVRLTLAAFIYGVEIDLKNIIKKYVAPFHEDIHFFNDSELQLKVIERFKKENPGVDYKNSIEDIVDFLDFGDTFTILKKNSVFLNKQTNDFLNSIFNEFNTK